MPQAKIGVIGGSGLYSIEGLQDIEEAGVSTPFGEPSDRFIIGTLNGIRVAFLPRHGRKHRIMPTELPSHANIYAFKSLGVEHIIAVNSCGSFKKELEPGHLIIPDQIIDRTRNRVNTFFGNGIVAHIPFAEPFCPELSTILYEAAKETGTPVHNGGTFIAMEGPAFSTRAESRLYKSWGADVVGMTVLPEAKLAREAEICYASIGCITDYDSWIERSDPVTVDMVLNVMKNNINAAKDIIKTAITRIPNSRSCECQSALSTALVTAPDAMPEATKKKLSLLLDKYLA